MTLQAPQQALAAQRYHRLGRSHLAVMPSGANVRLLTITATEMPPSDKARWTHLTAVWAALSRSLSRSSPLIKGRSVLLTRPEGGS